METSPTELETVREIRDEAIARSGRNREWQQQALEAIKRCALTLRRFTSADVFALMDPPSDSERRAMGAAFQTAQRNGLIRPTDEFVMGHRKNHGRPMRVWIAGRI